MRCPPDLYLNRDSERIPRRLRGGGVGSELKIDFILTVLRSMAVTGRTFPAASHGEGSVDRIEK